MSVMEEEGIFPFDAVSVGCSRFIRIPRDTFLKNWLKTPLAMLRFQSELQGRIFKSYNERLVGHRDLEGRIAQFFCYLLSCQDNEDNDKIFLELTRKEISNYLAVSTEAVIRKLSLWTKRKWILTKGNKIFIQNKKEIESLAGESRLILKKESSQKSKKGQIFQMREDLSGYQIAGG